MYSDDRFAPSTSVSDSHAVPELAMQMDASHAPSDRYGSAGHAFTSFARNVRVAVMSLPLNGGSAPHIAERFPSLSSGYDTTSNSSEKAAADRAGAASSRRSTRARPTRVSP